MTELELNEDLLKTFEHYGFENQRRKLVEEFDEFNKELILFNEGNGDIQRVILELGDVTNVLEQFRLALDICRREVFDARVEANIRTQKRTAEGYYEKRN